MPEPSTSGPPNGGFNSSDAPYIAPHYTDSNPQSFDSETGQFSENQPMRYSLNEMRNARGANNPERTVDPQVYRRLFYVIAVTVIIVGFAGAKKS